MTVGRVLDRLLVLALSVIALGATQSVAAQNAVITGQVMSDQGQALENAQVFVQELNIGVAVGTSGRYRLTIPSDRVKGQSVTVRARRVGFLPGSQPLTLTAGDHTVDFTLKTDIQRLAEVVTTGVSGATAQTKTPFSVTKIEAADMPVPASNPLSQLQGKVPGAAILASSGRPGTTPSILMRGPKSINASGRDQEPLILVDGVIVNGGLSDIDPTDIESVEVIKGAAGSTLYGSQAGNGVIAITTKRGRTAAEGVRFGLRTEFGASDIDRKFDMAERHALYLDETGTRFCRAVTGQPFCASTFDYLAEAARINNTPGDYPTLSTPSFTADLGSAVPSNMRATAFQINSWPGQTYDAINQFQKPSPYIQSTGDITGRFGGTAFRASVSNYKNSGAIRFLKGQERNSVRLNVDQEVRNDLTLALSSMYSHSSADGFNEEDGGTSFFRLTRVPPIVNLLQRDTLGRLYIRSNIQGGGQQNQNPLYLLENTQRLDYSDRYLGGLQARYTPLDWLEFQASGSYDLQNTRAVQFQDKGFRTTTNSPSTNLGNIYRATGMYQAWSGAVGGTVRHSFADDLTARFTTQYSFRQEEEDNRSMSGNTLAVVGIPRADNATANYNIGSDLSSIRSMSVAAATGIEWKDRYLIDAAVERDGYSLFGADNRWQNYARGSASWRVSEEPWWFVPQINEFKLRASYGTAGNYPNFAAQYETYTIGTGGVLTGSTLGNRNLGPERISEIEVGTDIGLFDRFTLNVTYAKSDNKDQILQVPLPAATGFESQWQNAATLQNKTWEVSLDVPLVTSKDLRWSTRFTYDRTRTFVTKLNVPSFDYGTDYQATGSAFRVAEGEEFGTFYGRKFLTSCSQLPDAYRSQCGASGAYQKNDDGYLVWVGEGNSWRDGITKNLWGTALPGDQSPFGVKTYFGMPMVLRDANGTAKISQLGNAMPRYRWANANNLSYKKLTVYALVDASVGRNVWNEGRHWSYLDHLSGDQDQTGKSVETAKPVGYYWRAAPPDNNAGMGGFYDILGPNSHFVEDASFVKIREVMVSYRIGQILGSGDWSIGVVGRNLHTFTNYKGFDPEVGLTAEAGGIAGSGILNAIDAFTFPNPRTLSFTLATSF